MSYLEKALQLKPILDLGRLAVEAGITVEDKPAELPDRPGYAWKPLLNGSVIGWEEVEDPDAEGTQNNPMEWTSGMTVKVNYWYTDSTIVKVCVQNGTPTDFEDENEVYFVAM